MDIRPVGAAAGKSDTPVKIREAATQFEALLITQMLQSAHGSGSGGEEDQNSTLTELGEQQLAQALAASGGLGVAKMVVEGLNTHAHR